MKFSITFILSFFILISNLFSQKITFCENEEKKEYTNISTRNILIGFKEDMYIDDIDDFIEKINLKIFTYKNDVLIIDKSSINYKYDGSIECIDFLLSKKTRKNGLKDLIVTLQETDEVLYANPFYYSGNNKYDRFAIKNSLIVELNTNKDFINLDRLAEKYNFDYEYNNPRNDNSIIIKLNKDSSIKIQELSCILNRTRYFKFIRLSKVAYQKLTYYNTNIKTR